MAKTKSERWYSRSEMRAAEQSARWGGYQDGMKRALEVAESQLHMATSYYREQSECGEVDEDTREGGILEGIRAVVNALRRSPELEGWRGR